MAIDEFTMKVPAEMEPLESPPSPPTHKPREMTVSYLGPHMPSLRLRGGGSSVPVFPSAQECALTCRRDASSSRQSSTKISPSVLSLSPRARRSRQDGAASSPG
jgi:hypothetical protein